MSITIPKILCLGEAYLLSSGQSQKIKRYIRKTSILFKPSKDLLTSVLEEQLCTDEYTDCPAPASTGIHC